MPKILRILDGNCRDSTIREEARSRAPEPVRLSSGASAALNALRILAAFAVLVSHWRDLFFIDYRHLDAPGRAVKVLYALCACGHQAVVVFFVLSGFLISGTIYRAETRGTWHWLSYLADRLTRLWIVLLPALLIGALWDHLGIAFGRAPLLYSGQSGSSSLAYAVAPRLGLVALLRNAVFLQTICGPTFGSNGPLWSLACEFWYYLIFPMGFCAVRSRGAARMGWIVSVMIACCLVGRSILLLFPIWLMGIGVHYIPRMRVTSRLVGLAALVFAPVFLGSALLGRHYPVTADYGLGVFTALLVMLFVSYPGVVRPIIAKVAGEAAGFSYSLYLVHFPFLLLSSSLLTRGELWRPDREHLAIATCVLLVSTVYAFAFASITEFRTSAVRSKIRIALSI